MCANADIVLKRIRVTETNIRVPLQILSKSIYKYFQVIFLHVLSLYYLVDSVK